MSKVQAPPLVGRERELQDIDRRLAAVAAGQGGIAWVTGPAGSGKTRLLAEAVARARSAGLCVMSAVAEAGAEMVPFAAFRNADLDIGTFDFAAESRFESLRVVSERLERAALIGPVLFVFDNVQWTDDATRFALQTLPQRLSSHPILWLLAARPFGPAEVLTPPLADISLAPLDPTAVQRLARELLGGEPDDDLLDMLAQADGRPFLVVELLRGLVEDGLVRRDDRHVRLEGRRVPVRVHEVVARQLLGLSPLAGDVARMAAILDRPCSPEDLARFLDVDDAALATAVQELLDAALLLHRGDVLAFRHDLLRESIAAAIEEPVARDLRRRAVAVLLRAGAAPGDMAPLLMRVAEPGDRPAIDVLRRAAATLSETSPANAADLGQRALELLPEADPDRAAIAAETIGHLYRAGRGSEARAVAGTVLRDGSTVSADAEAAIRLELAQLAVQYDCSQATREARLGLALVGISEPLRLYLQITETLGHLMVGDADSAGAVMLEDLAAARAAGDIAAEVAALNSCSAVYYRRDEYDQALAYANEASERAAGAADGYRLWPEIWAAWVRAGLALTDAALKRIDDGLPQAQADGRALDLAWWLVCRSLALCSAGRLVEARAEAEAAVQIGEDMGSEGAVFVTAHSILARIAVHTGDEVALRIGRDVAAEMQTEQSLHFRRNGDWIAALLADAAGDSAEALRQLADTIPALGTASPTQETSRDPAYLVTMLRIVLRAGERSHAEAVVAELERRAAMNPGYALNALWARHARALLERDAEGLRATSADADALLSPLARAQRFEDIAGVITDDAVALLARAHELYREARATVDARRVQDRLRELGKTVEPAPHVDLTDIEHAALELAARGATNRESAEQLGLTPLTVAALLRHTYAQLGIGSRSELQQRLA